jgi:hypothetical protein
MTHRRPGLTAPPSDGRRERPPTARHTPHRAAHLARTRQLAPWSRASTPELVPPPAVGRSRAPATPVFVDDSGRRRRAGRAIGGCLGALTFGYAAVVALTFAGVPVVGTLAPPGVEELSRPASGAGAGLGPGAQVVPLAPASDGQPETATAATGVGDARVPTAGRGAGAPTTAQAPVPSSPTTAPTTSTTLRDRGQGSTTSVPSPGSTVPTKPTHPTPGPPVEPPGKP